MDIRKAFPDWDDDNPVIQKEKKRKREIFDKKLKEFVEKNKLFMIPDGQFTMKRIRYEDKKGLMYWFDLTKDEFNYRTYKIESNIRK